MKTYRELLESKEWREKRETILDRDEHKCSLCKNLKLTSNLIESSAYFFNQIESFKLYKIREPIFNEINKYTIRNLFVNINTKSNQDMQVYYSLINEKVKLVAARPLHKYEGIKQIISKIENDINKEAKLLMYSIVLNLPLENLIENLNQDFSKISWIIVKGLHVHHKYYQLGKKPWEYPSNSLTTLCWICHEEIHKNAKVPFLNEEGVELDKITPCLRCYGAGYFPEYLHIDEGICFRCNGAKYEQFIEN